jgi:putative thioredoxin
MIDITLENFQTDLIEGSAQNPVLLDIWAEWCGPCKQLGPLLEKLETDYAGRFTLGTRSIPLCVLFLDGQPVDGFVGAQPEATIRTFLDKHVPSAEEVVAEQEEEAALDALAEGDTDTALERLQAAVATNPANADARFDYVKLLLTLGRTDDAKVAFAPVIDQTTTVRRFDALQQWMNAIDKIADSAASASAIASFDAKIAANKRDFDARFGKAQQLMAEQQWTAAMDELLEILMRDKTWGDERARKTYIAILELIEPPKPKVADGQIPPADPTVATYRRRLSSVVLS